MKKELCISMPLDVCDLNSAALQTFNKEVLNCLASRTIFTAFMKKMDSNR